MVSWSFGRWVTCGSYLVCVCLWMHFSTAFLTFKVYFDISSGKAGAFFFTFGVIFAKGVPDFHFHRISLTGD